MAEFQRGPSLTQTRALRNIRIQGASSFQSSERHELCTARIRLQLADGKALSEGDLKALGCQGVSQLEGGVWHLLIGDKAPSLSGALEALANRSEVSAKV